MDLIAGAGLVVFLTIIVLILIAVGLFSLLGLWFKLTKKKTPPPLTDEEKRWKQATGYRDPIRFFGQTGLRPYILARAGNQCEHHEGGKRCSVTTELQLDHIYPWFHGGWTVVDNAQVLCVEHNQDKGADIPNESELLLIKFRRARIFNVVLNPQYAQDNTTVRWKPTYEEQVFRYNWLAENDAYVHVKGQFKP